MEPISIDHRIHLALVIVRPTGYGLKKSVVEAIKALKDVNVLILVNCVDTVSDTELKIVKDKILKQIEFNNLNTAKLSNPKKEYFLF